MLWLSVERYSNQIVAFALQIFVARILLPSDYGYVAMVTVFTGLASIFIDSGFSQALIRKTDKTNADCSTVFYFNVGVSVFFYLVLFVSAPAIASFYNEPLLVPITRMVSISLILNATTSVHYVMMASSLNFKPFMISSFSATAVSGVIGIVMAYNGFGLWTIVWQSVIRASIYTLLIWIISSWRPMWIFSKESFRSLFSFGGKLLVCAIIDNIYNNLYNIVIGKAYNHEALGLYTRARGYADLPVNSTVGVIQNAIFPAMCSVKNDNERLTYIFRTYLKLSAYIIFPIMGGLAILAEPLVVFMITDKWIAIVPMMQILCVSFMWNPVHTINLNVFRVNASGNAVLLEDLLIKLSGVIAIIISSHFGLIGLCLGTVAYSLTVVVICAYFTQKTINISLWGQIMDILPSLLLTIVMVGCVHFSISFLSGNLLKLIVGTLIGIAIYVLLSVLFRNNEFFYLYRTVKNKFA